MASPNAARAAPARAGGDPRIEQAGKRLGQRNSKISVFRHAENIPSKATLARRFPRLRLNRFNGKWRDDSTGERGDTIESLRAFIRGRSS